MNNRCGCVQDTDFQHSNVSSFSVLWPLQLFSFKNLSFISFASCSSWTLLSFIFLATWHYSTTFIFFIISSYFSTHFSHSFIHEENRYTGLTLLHKPNSGGLTENRTHSQLFIRLVYIYFTHLVIFMMYVKAMRPSGKIYSLFAEINLCLRVWHCK